MKGTMKGIMPMRGLVLLAGVVLTLLAGPAAAQNVICSTAPLGDSSNRCASTAFVQQNIGTPPLAAGKIFIGSVGNLAAPQTFSGDGTLSIAGVFTLATVNANVGSWGSATQCPTLTVNAKGLITAASQAVCTPGLANITGFGSGVAAALANTLNAAGGLVGFNGALGTPTSGVAANLTGLPISTGLAGAGTGVLAALGVNIGSPGAFVTFNGAAGTPSSLTLTNAAGLPAGTGLTGQVAFANGGCGGTTQQSCFDNAAPTATRAGDISYWNGSHYVTLPGNNAGTKFLQEDASGVPSWTTVAGTGTVTSVVCGGLTITSSGTCPSPFFATNCTLAASVGASVLTVSLKDGAGADPSATSPCTIPFRSATAATGSTTFDSVTSALSIDTNVVGASLGASNGTAFRLWVVAFDNGGTVVLSLYNASTATSTTAQCFAINEGTVQTSIAMSGSATAAGTYYTPNGTTLTNKAIRLLGYVEYNSSGLVTAGTYASGPNFIQTFGPGLKRPCEAVQSVMATTTTGVSTTSAAYSTALTRAITPSSAANLIRVSSTGRVGLSTLTNPAYVTLFRTATQLQSEVFVNLNAATIVGGAGLGPYMDKPNTASSVTYTTQVASDGTHAATFAASGDGGVFGVLTVEEIQG